MSQLINSKGIPSRSFLHSNFKRAYCSSLTGFGFKEIKLSLQEHDNIVHSKVCDNFSQRKAF